MHRGFFRTQVAFGFQTLVSKKSITFSTTKAKAAFSAGCTNNNEWRKGSLVHRHKLCKHILIISSRQVLPAPALLIFWFYSHQMSCIWRLCFLNAETQQLKVWYHTSLLLSTSSLTSHYVTHLTMQLAAFLQLWTLYIIYTRYSNEYLSSTLNTINSILYILWKSHKSVHRFHHDL